MKDDLIGVFFTEVVPINLEEHLPLIVDFWQSSLIGGANYRNNPMEKHMRMSEKKQLKRPHLERWLQHWEETIHERYEGPIARQAISRARPIGEMILFKTGAE